MNLEGYFCEKHFLQKIKLNDCGILNLDSSSGDGTHWVLRFMKGKKTFYFDTYGVQPSSELIAYQSHQYFTTANESNKTVKCSADIYASSH